MRPIYAALGCELAKVPLALMLLVTRFPVSGTFPCVTAAAHSSGAPSGDYMEKA